jgi:arabinose-5-phosphate isomerase
VAQTLIVMSRTPGRPGAALVTEPDGSLAGIFTDGDLRRLLETQGAARLEDAIDDHMATDPKWIAPDALVEDAEHLLREHRKDQLPVLDEGRRPVGLVDVQDLLDLRV